MVMAVAQWDLGVPAAVGLAFHGMGVGVPVVEAANDVNGFGFRGDTQKVGRQREFFRRIPITPARRVRIYRKHTLLCSSCPYHNGLTAIVGAVNKQKRRRPARVRSEKIFGGGRTAKKESGPGIHTEIPRPLNSFTRRKIKFSVPR